MKKQNLCHEVANTKGWRIADALSCSIFMLDQVMRASMVRAMNICAMLVRVRHCQDASAGHSTPTLCNRQYRYI